MRIVPLQQGSLLFERLLDRLENRRRFRAPRVMLKIPESVSSESAQTVDPRAAPDAGGINQHLLHQRIREREPRLQEVDAEGMAAYPLVAAGGKPD